MRKTEKGERVRFLNFLTRRRKEKLRITGKSYIKMGRNTWT